MALATGARWSHGLAVTAAYPDLAALRHSLAAGTGLRAHLPLCGLALPDS